MATFRKNAKRKSSGKKQGSLQFLPKPWRYHRQEILLGRVKKRMNMDTDDRQVEFSQMDERLKTVPFGCLSLHVLELLNLGNFALAFEESVPVFYYCVLRVGRIERVSGYVQSPTPRRVRMDAVFLLSLELSEWRNNYRNRMSVEVWAFQDPAEHYVIGSAKLHLYEMIRHVHGIERHYIWGEGALRGKMVYEYAFAYGAFGFGHSNQFRNTEIPVFEGVAQSMFPRIGPDDDDILDPVSHTVLPQQLWRVSTESCMMENVKSQDAVAKFGEDKVGMEPFPKLIDLFQVQFQDGRPTNCKLQMPIYQEELEADFNSSYGEYLCLNDREKRLQFLKDMVTGRQQDVKETDYATTLFLPIEASKLAEAHKSTDLPGAMSFPSELPCLIDHKSVTYPEDAKLLKGFPSVERTSGYLGRLFGFQKPEEEKKSEFPYKMWADGVVHKPQVNNRLWFRYVRGRFWAGLRALKRLLCAQPPLQYSEVPVISITFPTPAVSTSDLHALWVQEEVKRRVYSDELILSQEAVNYGLPPVYDFSQAKANVVKSKQNETGRGSRCCSKKPRSPATRNPKIKPK